MQCKIKISKLTVALLFLVLITAVSIYSDTGSNNISANSIFNPQHILEIKITMSEKDWDLMKKNGTMLLRLGRTALKNPNQTLTIFIKPKLRLMALNIHLSESEKHQFLGSTSLRKPSLGIRFNEYDKQLKFGGLKKIESEQ